MRTCVRACSGRHACVFLKTGTSCPGRHLGWATAPLPSRSCLDAHACRPLHTPAGADDGAGGGGRQSRSSFGSWGLHKIIEMTGLSSRRSDVARGWEGGGGGGGHAPYRRRPAPMAEVAEEVGDVAAVALCSRRRGCVRLPRLLTYARASSSLAAW